jgi:plastocyanin
LIAVFNLGNKQRVRASQPLMRIKHLQHAMKNYLSATTLAILLSFGFATSSFAATAVVLVGSGGNFFVPAVTNINAGDTVTWNWAGGPHSVTSTNSLWTDTGLHSPAFSFSHTFPSGGAFFYFCTLHGTATSGMMGHINVTAPNSPPSVTITNPVSGTVLAAPANVNIQASASDSDGSVTNVQFLVGSVILTNKAAAPFFAVTNNLPAGPYTLTAIASDNLGATATNSVSLSVVTPVTLTIGSPLKSVANFQFNYSANTGLTYVVQRSTNLVISNWTSIFTNTAASNPVVFVDTHATNNPGFYRVGRLPNP